MLEQADAQHDQRINELQLVRTTGSLLPEGGSAQRMHLLFQHSSMAQAALETAATPPNRLAPIAAGPERLSEVPTLQLRVARQLQQLPSQKTASWW